MVEPTKTIAELNDAFRRADPSIPGKTLLTQGIVGLLRDTKTPLSEMAQMVAQFNDFSKHNDPHGEHDFGVFQLGGATCVWKIDAYDLDYRMGSEDPSLPRSRPDPP